jgi:membrane protease YdiL (CAAX protease family)
MVRTDGSSRLNPDDRWLTYYSAGFAWRISQENFLKNSNVVSDLKLRLSYGITGQQDGIGNYSYLANYGISNQTAQYQLGNQFFNMYRPIAYNPKLTWEQTATSNIGLDYGFFKDKFSNYGLSIKGALKDYKIYLLLIGIMLPIVITASFTESFQHKYPFYKLQEGEGLFPRFFIWECLYLLQFFAVEFFFRGFMLHGNKQRFGFYSILVMTIPYCMIHFGKPLPETLAAIVAGLVLGVLSLKSNSIWLGVAIHFSVAITMDFCSLWQKGYFS